METNTKGRYSDVTFDAIMDDRHYTHPLTRRFQYEYALYETVSDLFESVRCRSMCMESLELYFAELPHAKEGAEAPKKGTQESVLSGMKALVERDVAGNVVFPMMHMCACESQCILEEDGTHSFVFSDGIYGFSVRLKMTGNGQLKGIKVANLTVGKTVVSSPVKESVKDYAEGSAA